MGPVGKLTSKIGIPMGELFRNNLKHVHGSPPQQQLSYPLELFANNEARAELAGVTMKELRACAKTNGASAEQLEAAADSEDHKMALVELLLQLEGAVLLETKAAAQLGDFCGHCGVQHEAWATFCKKCGSPL
jgi:hypothetical protein